MFLLMSTWGYLLNGHLTRDLQSCSCHLLRAQTSSQGLSTEGLDRASHSLCLSPNIDLDWEEGYPSIFIGNTYSLLQRIKKEEEENELSWQRFLFLST
jgi:hypothetical protein